LVLALSVFCGVGEAAPSRQSLFREAVPSATFAVAHDPALTPYGWVDFCNRYQNECHPGVLPPADLELTSKSWTAIRRVNSLVNGFLKPMSDLDHWGVVDRWDIPTDGYGDCEDYVLLKRKLLMEEGLPRQALLVTVVKDERGDGHAVLTVKTDRGEFVLDNMRESVLPWAELPYRFVKRQSQTDENEWLSIGEPTPAPLIVSR